MCALGPHPLPPKKEALQWERKISSFSSLSSWLSPSGSGLPSVTSAARAAGCCGGGDYKPRKKKLPHVAGQKTFQVEGMHCEHCKVRVEEAVNDIKGAAGKVDLKKGLLTVSYAESLDDEQVKQKVERAGYHLTGTR